MAKTHKIPFSKMHGAGNDFIIINQIDHDYNLSAQDISEFSNRNFGIGFDQLLIIEKSTHPNAEFKYRIFNADGKEVNQCGNGARCFFHYLRLKELTKYDELIVETRSGLIELSYKENELIAVDMGKPIFENNRIPFKPNQSTDNIITVNNQEYKFYPVSMGNPHAVIELNTFDNINLISIGKALQGSLMFPEGVNVNFLKIIDSQNLASTISSLARNKGLSIDKIQPVDDNSYIVTINNGEFVSLFGWMKDLDEQRSISVTKASIKRSTSNPSNKIRAQMVLSLTK